MRVPERHAHAVSGNVRVHYRPDATLSIKPAEELLAILQNPPPDTGFLVHSVALRESRARHLYVMPEDHRAYRRALYATLHELDRQVNRIWVEEPPDGPEWLDIWDRLSRAAAG